MLTPAAESGILALQQIYGEALSLKHDGQGGAYVIVDHLFIGKSFQPNLSWVGFLISFQYPYPDIYPHFTCGNLIYKSGPLPGGLSKTTWPGKPGESVIQISRKSLNWNPSVDTAITKLEKVLSWLREL